MKPLIDLSSYQPIDRNAHHSLFTSKCAFTLAEVLITLGVIGVVAALTIPTLLTNYRAKKMRTELLRANSIIQQAVMLAKADEVNLDTIIEQDKYEEFEKYFKNGSCKLPANAREAKYKNYSGKYYAIGAAANKLLHSYCLFDGMTLWFGAQVQPTRIAFLSIDINGWQEKPNRYGHDVFFWFYNSNTQMIEPIGENNKNFTSISGYDYLESCAVNGREACEKGIACTKKAINDKNYFKNLPK